MKHICFNEIIATFLFLFKRNIFVSDIIYVLNKKRSKKGDIFYVLLSEIKGHQRGQRENPKRHCRSFEYSKTTIQQMGNRKARASNAPLHNPCKILQYLSRLPRRAYRQTKKIDINSPQKNVIHEKCKKTRRRAKKKKK